MAGTSTEATTEPTIAELVEIVNALRAEVEAQQTTIADLSTRLEEVKVEPATPARLGVVTGSGTPDAPAHDDVEARTVRPLVLSEMAEGASAPMVEHRSM